MPGGRGRDGRGRKRKAKKAKAKAKRRPLKKKGAKPSQKKKKAVQRAKVQKPKPDEKKKRKAKVGASASNPKAIGSEMEEKETTDFNEWLRETLEKYGPHTVADSDSDKDAISSSLLLPGGFQFGKSLDTLPQLIEALREFAPEVIFRVHRCKHPCDLTTRICDKCEKDPSVPKADDIFCFVRIEDVDVDYCPTIGALVADEEKHVLSFPLGFMIFRDQMRIFSPFCLTRLNFLTFLTKGTAERSAEGNRECVICCEEVCGKQKCVTPCRSALSCGRCGCLLCYVCVFGIAFGKPKLMFRHPNGAQFDARFKCPMCLFKFNSTALPTLSAHIVIEDHVDECPEQFRLHLREFAKMSDEFKSRKCVCCCGFCKKKLTSIRGGKRTRPCPKCGGVRYCSRVCLLRHSEKHAEDCRLWSLAPVRSEAQHFIH